VPIHDTGYRAWHGQPESPWGRWWVIAQTGIRLAWRSQWLRRMLFLAWLPSIYLGAALFFYEQMTRDGRTKDIVRVLPQFPEYSSLVRKIVAGDESARRDFWALILFTLFRYPQGILMVLLVGIIAPPLISNDLRSRAYLLYFSRPIDRLDYVVGKSFVVWTYLFLITALPALGLYVLGVALSPDLGAVWSTWDLPLRVLAAAVWLIVPTTAMALCFSSLTTESRYAGAAWFATWAMGWTAYTSLTTMDSTVPQAKPTDWTLVSLYHSLGRIQSWVFGLESDYQLVIPPVILIALLTVVCLAVLIRRVAAPLRV
jgi:hypothetical protein